MGPKISEAKTPPLRKPASPFSLPSSTLTPLSPFFSALSLLLNTSFSLIRTQKKSLLYPQVPAPKPLSEICISVLSLLSACSKFKHAYGGRMCLWSPCASLWRVLLCLSPTPRQLLFLLYAASLSHHSILPSFFLSVFFLSLSIYPSFSSSTCLQTPNIIVTRTNVYTLDVQARMGEHTSVRRHTTMHMHT